MLRTLPARRRSPYGAQVCAVIAVLLLLLSVSILHSRLKFNPQSHLQTVEFTHDSTDDLDALVANPLLEDIENDGLTNAGTDDLIDEHDVVEEQQSKVSDEEEILRGLEDDSESDPLGLGLRRGSTRRGTGSLSGSGYYWDHVRGVLRRSFDKQLMDPLAERLSFGDEDLSRVAFASDDLPVNEEVRVNLDEIRGIEDALLLKTARKNLREGWVDWFKKKGDFLRRDRMLKSSVEHLNPENNALLQDPDGIGLSVLTRGDKIMQKALVEELLKLPPLGKKPVEVTDMDKRRDMNVENVGVKRVDIRSRIDVKGVERRTLDHNGSVGVDSKSITSPFKPSILTKTVDVDGDTARGEIINGQIMLEDKRSNKATVELNNGTSKVVTSSMLEFDQQIDTKNLDNKALIKPEISDNVYADGKRWGYFPGLYSHLSFSDFMDEFFKHGNCSMRVFMVWNSSPWKYTVRHQRGLESLLYHHPEACVVVFSETIDLDFFKDFLKDGFKVAVAMPNLDELLKDTPAHVFASAWFEWRRTKFYPIHYSELVRLAALYKYGGVYLDSDIIVLKPLSSFNNSIGTEDESARSSFNGALMTFSKNSPFLWECLREFYATYDDTLLRWNGAELLTRTVRKFLTQENSSRKQSELKIEPSSKFFPISPQDITRYFTTPDNETERNKQYTLLHKILDGSYTFHFWDGLTSSLIPEPESLVAKLLNRHCVHCSDVF